MRRPWSQVEERKDAVVPYRRYKGGETIFLPNMQLYVTALNRNFRSFSLDYQLETLLHEARRANKEWHPETQAAQQQWHLRDAEILKLIDYEKLRDYYVPLEKQ